MSCHLDPQQLPPSVAQNQKRKQTIKGQGRNHAQINGRNRPRVVSKKRLPALRRRLRRPRHVFRNRRLGDFEPEHQKLTMDPGCAPQRVFSAHPLDQIPQAAIDLWPPYPIAGPPTPEHFKASAMPSQDGLRLNNLGRTKKARPEPGHTDEQGTVAAAKPKTRWSLPQSNGELMAEKQILSFKPAPRLE